MAGKALNKNIRSSLYCNKRKKDKGQVGGGMSGEPRPSFQFPQFFQCDRRQDRWLCVRMRKQKLKREKSFERVGNEWTGEIGMFTGSRFSGWHLKLIMNFK